MCGRTWSRDRVQSFLKVSQIPVGTGKFEILRGDHFQRRLEVALEDFVSPVDVKLFGTARLVFVILLKERLHLDVLDECTHSM